jgi:hypothetical protein
MEIVLLCVFVIALGYFAYLVKSYIGLANIAIGKIIPFNHSGKWENVDLEKSWENVDLEKSVETATDNIGQFFIMSR